MPGQRVWPLTAEAMRGQRLHGRYAAPSSRERVGQTRPKVALDE
jgi:hypothetical protein